MKQAGSLNSAHRKAVGRDRRARSRGFTLAELIVSSIILVVVVGATTLAISQSLRSRDAATAAGEAFSRAQTAASRIAADAGQALRDQDLTNGKVAIIRGGPGGRSAQGLLLLTHQNRNARSGSDAMEDDEYEVQYRLEPAPVVARNSAPSFSLWRRADPIPDEYIDAGGIATPIVDGVTSLTIDAYDGASWRSDWDSDNDGYPHALRIVVTAADDTGRRTVTARRVVAFDRTPAPKSEDDATGSATTGTGAAASPAAGNGGGG